MGSPCYSDESEQPAKLNLTNETAIAWIQFGGASRSIDERQGKEARESSGCGWFSLQIQKEIENHKSVFRETWFEMKQLWFARESGSPLFTYKDNFDY